MSKSKNERLRINTTTLEVTKANEDEWAKAGHVPFSGHWEITHELIIGLPGHPQSKVLVRGDKQGNLFLGFTDES
jgi:hypothetical protein